MSRNRHSLRPFRRDPVSGQIRFTLKYLPHIIREFFTASWLMLQRRMRKHLTSATFIAAVIDGVGSFGYGAQVKGVMTPLIEAFLWGMYTLSIVREPGPSEGGVV
jgi:hypothetical protein